jgi:RNA methyltransferase, TrmH family
MRDSDTIRSRANPLLKRVAAVLAGRESGTIALEGDRLVDDALGANIALEVVLVADDREERAAELERRTVRVQVVEAQLLSRVSSLKSSPGILALAPTPRSIDLGTLALDGQALVLVVAGIADPGNLGALARAAEAFGVRALVALPGGASPWNEKALRGSMGSLLRLPVCTALDAGACAALLAKRGLRQACAVTRGGKDPRSFDWKGPIALWITGETGAHSEAASKFERLTIPISESVESLNVTVAASILLYASGRVRSA